MVRFVGYYSDGNNHLWELGFATDPLIGPEDISPTDACGDDISNGSIEVNPNDDCLSLYLYSAGALSNLAVGAATTLALASYALF